MEVRMFMGIPREAIPWAPLIDSELCIGCGECLDTCANDVFAMNDDEGKMEVVNPDNCVVLCDKCAPLCATDAISFPDKDDTKRLLGRLLREQRVGANTALSG